MINFQNDRPGVFASFRDSLRVFLYVGATSLWSLLTGVLASRSLRPVLLPVRSRRRAAGMLEYALIAALAVGVFLFLRRFFDGLFKDVTKDISDNLDDPVQIPITPSGSGG